MNQLERFTSELLSWGTLVILTLLALGILACLIRSAKLTIRALLLSVSMEEMPENVHTMTVLESLAVLEAAVLECKKRDIDTPEIREALDLLEPHIQPAWLIPQFRHHALNQHNKTEVDGEGQQQVLRATFPAIHDAVRELLGVRMDALACKFYETHDLAVSNEIYRLAGEYGKLKEPWVFVAG